MAELHLKIKYLFLALLMPRHCTAAPPRLEVWRAGCEVESIIMLLTRTICAPGNKFSCQGMSPWLIFLKQAVLIALFWQRCLYPGKSLMRLPTPKFAATLVCTLPIQCRCSCLSSGCICNGNARRGSGRTPILSWQLWRGWEARR